MPSLRLISELFKPSRRCAVASRMSRARSTAVAVLGSFSGFSTLTGFSAMTRSYKFRLCSLHRILVQHAEHNVVWLTEFLLQDIMHHEQQFSILNNLCTNGSFYPSHGSFL